MKRILFVEHAADYFTSRDVRDVYFAERLGGFRFRLRPIKHVLNMEIRMVGAFGEVGSK